MNRWRIVVHALDRTGPPVLARTFLEWVRSERRDVEVDVVSLRGGPLIDDFLRLADVEVLLEPSEPWNTEQLSPERTAILRDRIERLPTPDATLLVSVSAGQVLPILPEDHRVVTWVVEQGEDLDWIDRSCGLRERTSTWLAGSESSLEEAAERLHRPVELVREFVARPQAIDFAAVQRCRAVLAPDPDELLVVGAGIGTRRKGPDLFLEVALAHQRNSDHAARFVWFGGERDPLHWPVRDEARRCGVRSFSVMDSVADLTPWLAAADVFLHTPRLDAFPLVCLHAAVAGTPTVTFSGVGGTTEMFRETFIGAPYPDVTALAREVERLAYPAAHSRAATAQRDRVLDNFVVDVCAPHLADALVPTRAERHSG